MIKIVSLNQTGFICLIFYCLLPSQLFAQNSNEDFFVVSGTVWSQADSTRVGYAHVYVQNKATGVVCNSEGQFELKIPMAMRNDSVVVSAVGFSTQTFSFQKDSTINIFLTESIQYLNEVVVSGKGFDSAKHILNSAIHFIKFNYPSKAHLIEGFFRELSLKDTVYTRLIEAAVVIQEKGYDQSYFKSGNIEELKSKVKVIELRKSDDFREYSWLDRISIKLLGERNELYMLLRGNYVRILGQKSDEHFLSKNNREKTLDCEYEGRSELNGVPVYILTLKTIAKTNFRLEHITLYINQSDYAIQKIVHEGLPNPSMKQIKSSWLIDGKYFDRLEVSYRKITHKYYPTFIHASRSIYGASATVKNDGHEQKQYADMLFLLTDIHEEDYKRIKGREAQEHDEDIYKQEFPYNEVFWNSYNTVKLNPLRRGGSDLEKEKSLNEQFKKN